MRSPGIGLIYQVQGLQVQKMAWEGIIRLSLGEHCHSWEMIYVLKWSRYFTL